ncbi:MAG: hypothetical protein ACREGF_02340, partial [Candidatus Saccharimonadales bacterium]
MKHKLFGISFSLLIIFSSIVSLIPPPQKAQALPANSISLQHTAFNTVLLNATIYANLPTPNMDTKTLTTFSFKNATFTDGAPWDTNHEYDDSSTCKKSTITFSNDNNQTNANLRLYTENPIGCNYVDYTAKATDLSAASPVFDWTSPTTITATDSDGLGNIVLIKQSGSSEFVNTQINKDILNDGGFFFGVGGFKSCQLVVTPNGGNGNAGPADATCFYAGHFGEDQKTTTAP